MLDAPLTSVASCTGPSALSTCCIGCRKQSQKQQSGDVAPPSGEVTRARQRPKQPRSRLSQHFRVCTAHLSHQLLIGHDIVGELQSTGQQQLARFGCLLPLPQLDHACHQLCCATDRWQNAKPSCIRYAPPVHHCRHNTLPNLKASTEKEAAGCAHRSWTGRSLGGVG